MCLFSIMNIHYSPRSKFKNQNTNKTTYLSEKENTYVLCYDFEVISIIRIKKKIHGGSKICQQLTSNSPVIRTK